MIRVVVLSQRCWRWLNVPWRNPDDGRIALLVNCSARKTRCWPPNRCRFSGNHFSPSSYRIWPDRKRIRQNTASWPVAQAMTKRLPDSLGLVSPIRRSTCVFYGARRNRKPGPCSSGGVHRDVSHLLSSSDPPLSPNLLQVLTSIWWNYCKTCTKEEGTIW